MKFLSGIIILGGYILVYAAVAKQGQFATEPWAGLYADAYQSIGQTVGGPIGIAGQEIGGAIKSVGQQVGQSGK